MDSKDIKPAKPSKIGALRPGKGLKSALSKVTEEMYKRNYELAQTNKTLNLLRRVDSIALESHDEIDVFLEKISSAIMSVAEYHYVSIIAKPANNSRLDNIVGLAVQDQLPAQELKILRGIAIANDNPWIKDQEKIQLITAENIFTRGIVPVVNSKKNNESLTDIYKTLKLESFAIVKLIARTKMVGVMIVGFKEHKKSIIQYDVNLISRLGSSLGIALDSQLLVEENKRIVEQIKHANDKLKALDETKDDFISMASHQLRTPLTSVKGYVSMLLEGDAGDITPMQKEMLGQAFFSAQRMVYLISDLLNVSRLKTGKFIIEPTEVNLAEMVEQELSQLQETAEAKKLKLFYNKPTNFPSILLDETKTRQVIMNFADNAIYYTPTGGEITVEIEDKLTSVELRVVDSGIGVPKNEQHHLFTKFYRAGNARKARPDGTGLGLYMAKKVIIAEGGSVIFESTEGKGSTFGFSFPKKNNPKMKVIAVKEPPK